MKAREDGCIHAHVPRVSTLVPFIDEVTIVMKVDDTMSELLDSKPRTSYLLGIIGYHRAITSY